jgi:LCP family protein required for cell wall assembly
MFKKNTFTTSGASQNPLPNQPQNKAKNQPQDPPSHFDALKDKPKRKWWKIGLIVFIVAILIFGAWMATGVFGSLSKIFTKNKGSGSPFLAFLGNVQAEQLKGEGDGRINILLLGMGGGTYPGGDLTDTIMIASIDPKHNDMAMLSVPRDLYVDIPGNGYSKVNAAFHYGESMKQSGMQVDGKDVDGPELTKMTISEIVDLPIHYYIAMDFQGFTKLVDKLGGLDIYNDKKIYDPYYPSPDFRYEIFELAKGQYHMNGDSALKYARSRKTTSDFDRARRQQKVISAIKEKALSLNILANPKKIIDLAKILGDHIRTDIQPWEMERLVSVTREIDTSKIITKVIDDSPTGPLVGKTINGLSTLVTKTGDYSEIQNIAHSIFTDPYLAEEKARVVIQNGTGNSGLAARVAATLKSYGYNVIEVGNAAGLQSKTEIIDYTDNRKPFTLKFLASRLNARIRHATPTSDDSPDLMIIIGANYQAK